MATENLKFVINASDRTRAAFKSVGRGLRTLESQAKIAALSVGAIGTAAVAMSARTIDSLAKTSDKLGIATDQLAGLRHAAELTGVAQNTLDMALQRMTRRVSEAAQGTGEARDALRELNLDAGRLAQLAPDEQFRAVADAMAGVATQGDRVRLAMRLFDSEGVAVVNTLALQRAGLDAAAEEARRFGIAISRVDAAKVEAANDQMLRARQALSGVANTLTIELAPYIAAVAERFAQATAETQGFKEEIAAAVNTAVKGFGLVADAIWGWRLIFQSVEIAWLTLKAAVLDGLVSMTERIDAMLRKIPLIGYEGTPALESLKQSAADANLALADAYVNLDLLLMGGRPSEGLQATFEAIKAKAIETAAAIASARSDLVGGSSGDATVQAPDALDAELEQAIRDEELLAIQEHNQRIQEAYLRHQAELGDIASQGALGRLEFERKTWNAQTKMVLGELSALTAGVAQHNRAMFEINKAAATAEAIVNAHEGASRTLAKYPWPLGPALAALHYAAGVARVAAIQSTTFQGGGGGTTPSSAGSTPTVNDQPVLDQAAEQSGGGTVQIVFNGPVTGDAGIREAVLSALDESIEYDRLVIEDGSLVVR